MITLNIRIKQRKQVPNHLEVMCEFEEDGIMANLILKSL